MTEYKNIMEINKKLILKVKNNPTDLKKYEFLCK